MSKGFLSVLIRGLKTLFEIVDHALDAVRFEGFLDELKVQRMNLVIILGLLAREDQIQGDLIALVHHRAMAGDHSPDMEVEQTWNGFQISFGPGQQGIGGFRVLRIGPKNDDV